MTNFVLMLTRDDVTVPDAHAILELALSAGTEHIGVKDIGLPRDEMAALVDTIHAAGRQAHPGGRLAHRGRRTELTAARSGAGIRLRARRDPLAARRRGACRHEHRYFPYAGTVIGHPGTLDGTAEQILADIEAMRESVTGVNLLAYRHIRLDGDSLVQEICATSPIPVLVAGAVASVDRIRFVRDAGAWGFTVGAAVLDRRVVPGANVSTQLRTVLDAASEVEA